jgi:GT2 family glycosyltransferase
VRILTDLLTPLAPPNPVDPAPTSAQGSPRPNRGLDVVVVNYRTPNDLNGFLASYAAYPCFWVGSLTVANVQPGPADTAVVDRWQATIPMNHLVFRDNVGYARACNRAALLGQGDVVGLFNADVVLRAEALTHCYEALKGDASWGVLGPRQVDDSNRLVGCGVFGAPQSPRQRAWMEPDTGQCSDIRTDALTVSGSAYFVRRETWRMLTECPVYREAAPDAEGAFLPTQHYYEETFCSYHARAHGLAAVFFGPVVITHLWHRASTHGGLPDQQMGVARDQFRKACDLHGITHE